MPVNEVRARVISVSEWQLVRKSGIMGVVLKGGPVKAGDGIRIDPPRPPHERLDVV